MPQQQQQQQQQYPLAFAFSDGDGTTFDATFGPVCTAMMYALDAVDLTIVVDGGAVEKGVVIPFDATHLHYGKAQKEAVIELEPGTHTLTLQFANAKHESFGKKFAKTITVNVQ